MKSILMSFLFVIIAVTAMAQYIPENFGFEIIDGRIYKNGEEVGWEKEDVTLVNGEIENPHLSQHQAYKEAVRLEIQLLVKQKNVELSALAKSYPQAKESLEELMKAHFIFAKQTKALCMKRKDTYQSYIMYLYDSYKQVEHVSPEAALKAKDIINHLYVYSNTGIGDISTIVNYFLKMSKMKTFDRFTYNVNWPYDIPREKLFLGPGYFEDLSVWYNSLVRTEELNDIQAKAIEHYYGLSNK